MDKIEGKKIVLDAYDEVRRDVGPDLLNRIGVSQKLDMVRKKLPTKPKYSKASIWKFLFGRNTIVDNEGIHEVREIYDQLKADIGPNVFVRIGVSQQMDMVQEKLPKIPLYSEASVWKFLFGKDA